MLSLVCPGLCGERAGRNFLALFDQAMVRFATCGTLLLCYGAIETLARRGGSGPDRPGVPPPHWLKPASIAIVGAFYLLIGPTGLAVAGGWGNAIGVAVAAAAMALRYAVRHGVSGVRQPAVAARMVFYAALPLATGTLWGWLVLTVPALVMSAHCSVRQDRILSQRLGAPYADLMSRTHRWVPGMW